jgi:hypothetical protein
MRNAHRADLAEALAAAAVAVEARDAEELAKIIAALRRAGYEPTAVLPGPLLAAMAAGQSHERPTAATGRAGDDAGDGQIPPVTSTGPTDPNDPTSVAVYDPLYTARGGNTSDGHTAAGAHVPLDAAWAAARDRAARSLADGDIPSQYRQLVQDFFNTDADAPE